MRKRVTLSWSSKTLVTSFERDSVKIFSTPNFMINPTRPLIQILKYFECDIDFEENIWFEIITVFKI